jgi:hypothetical protein
VFWNEGECSLLRNSDVSPVNWQIKYAHGESLLYVLSGGQLLFMPYGKDPDYTVAQAQWSPVGRNS